MSNPKLNLRTVEHPRGTWIYDGDQLIAFWFHRGLLLDIWQFGPHDEPLARPTEIPRIYDMNSYFNMHAMLRWEVEDRSSPPQQIEQRWLPQPDGGLLFEMLGQYDNGDHTRHAIEVGYDSEQDKYTFIFAADLWYCRQVEVEFLNFYPMYACNSQRDLQRYTHTVWTARDGQWHSLPHNGVYTSIVAAPPHKYAPASGGQIGYGANPEFNPLLTALEATPGLHWATCTMWRDEHFIIDAGSVEGREAGFYHTSARMQLENLPEAEMRAIMKQAEPVPISPEDQERCCFPGFTIGEVSDFEHPLPVDQPGYHAFWPVGDEQPHLRWRQGKGFSGDRCLALSVSLQDPEARAFPLCANPHCGVNQRCRLTAWVDTTELQGEAWIALARIEYSQRNVTDRARSRRLPGGQKWAQLSVEFDSGDQPFILPELWAEGQGQACFDEVLCEVVG